MSYKKDRDNFNQDRKESTIENNKQCNKISGKNPKQHTEEVTNFCRKINDFESNHLSLGESINKFTFLSTGDF